MAFCPGPDGPTGSAPTPPRAGRAGGRRGGAAPRARAATARRDPTAAPPVPALDAGGRVGTWTARTLAAGPVGAGPAAGRAGDGLAVLGLGPAAIALAITLKALADEERLPAQERAARRDGRVAAVVAAGVAFLGVVAQLRPAGPARTGAATGLARLGRGSVIAGATSLLTTPALAARVGGYAVYRLSARLRGVPPAGSATPAGAPADPHGSAGTT